ncbi:MAG: FG-GAP-like repeat-containing protein, partial [Pirellulaceae bacterium]
MRSRLLLGGLFCLGLVLLSVWAYRTWRWRSVDDLVREARDALADGQWYRSQDLVARALRREPQCARALVTAGEVAEKLDRPDEALRFYEQAVDDGSLDSIVATGAAGDLRFQLGYLTDAEARFRAVLRHAPRHVAANRRLATLLTLEGRRWESIPYLYELLRQEQYTIAELVLLGSLKELYDDTPLLERSIQALPADPIPMLGLARMADDRGQPDRTAEWIAKVLAVYGDLQEAQATKGRWLLKADLLEEARAWAAHLPPSADAHPDIWFLRGELAEVDDQPEGALRCYWETLQRNPNDAKANYRISQLLLKRNDAETARLFLRRSEHLVELEEILHRILFNERSLETLMRAGRLTESLGRWREAWGWYYAAAYFHPGDATAGEQRDRVKRQIRPETPMVQPATNPALRVDYASYPVPSWHPNRPSDPLPPIDRLSPSHISFEDEAVTRGIDFTYFNGTNAEVSGIMIYQTLGGGSAVLDFNGDGWPDIYFGQAGDWPIQPKQQDYLNRLFLNLDGERFSDVTAAAGCGDNGFGGGAAVGDYDSDGFPDLYVANIGKNRLYRNNGDGTFSDVTDESGLSGSVWTVSCLLADLSGDGDPDIYDVNYLRGRAPFERKCIDEKNGLMRTCKPQLFTGEQDQLFVSRGDRSFRDVTSTAGILQPDGKGLGLLAANLAGSDGPSWFVANDSTANFFFLNRTRRDGDLFDLAERAAISGLAFDGSGQRQACMGVAADDADGDGLLDLFVTNFYAESNTLYLQREGGLFEDASREAALRESSWQTMGFGTQFLDADLDGWPDLIVLNGHIDDFRHKNIPWKMPAQFYHNQGGGRFVEAAADTLGPYFQQMRLGRGATRVDWNRDGKEDIIASHMGAPVSLLTNRTAHAGHFLAVRLRGVASNRDAIGTIVSLTAGDRVRVKQLTAGDGFCASNQRQLLFGLGDHDRCTKLHVAWPSGSEQTFEDLPCDTEILLIEG